MYGMDVCIFKLANYPLLVPIPVHVMALVRVTVNRLFFFNSIKFISKEGDTKKYRYISSFLYHKSYKISNN